MENIVLHVAGLQVRTARGEAVLMVQMDFEVEVGALPPPSESEACQGRVHPILNHHQTDDFPVNITSYMRFSIINHIDEYITIFG